MEVAFYNETKSILNQQVEIYPAYVFSLFADQVNLMCYNSTMYNLLNLQDKWDDKMIRVLYDHFETAYEGKYALHYSKIDQVFAGLSIAKKMKRKSKLEFNVLNTGNLLKKSMKEIFTDNLKEILYDHGVLGLQKLIDNEIVRMYNLLSLVNSDPDTMYIKEIRDMFMKYDDYLLFGETVKAIYHILPVDRSLNIVPALENNDKPAIISVELFDFPVLSNIGSDLVYYLRQQLYPEFAGFRKQLDIFRDDLSEIHFESKNFNTIIQLFQKQISYLLTPLQQKTDEQLFIQHARNLYKDMGFKLQLGITDISSMIGYFPKTGIVSDEVAEASKRILNRETDINRTELFFYINFYTGTYKF